MSEFSKDNPYATPASGATDKQIPLKITRHLLPCVLFPISFLSAAFALALIQDGVSPALNYVQSL